MKQGWNTVGGVMDEPVLYSSHTITQHIGIGGFLHGEL